MVRRFSCQHVEDFESNPKLREQYVMVGIELLELEGELSVYSAPSQFARSRFRQGVVFVPTEVLESYLEDLLSAGVPDQRLGIVRHNTTKRFLGLLAASIGFALLCGLYAASVGYSLLLSFVLTVLLATPAGLTLLFSPQLAFARRMKFARLLSAEIARRHGGDSEGRLKNFLKPKILIPGFGQQAPEGAAKVRIH